MSWCVTFSVTIGFIQAGNADSGIKIIEEFVGGYFGDILAL